MTGKTCNDKLLNKHFSKKTTYRITYEDAGKVVNRNYIYIGTDKFHQKIFRPVKHAKTSEYDESLSLICPIKIVDLKI